MPKKPDGLIITGINQGAGSTTIAASLARICAVKGHRTGVMCPVETGVDQCEKPGQAGKLLKWAAKSEQEDDQVSPYRFKTDLEPASAAAKENSKIDFNHLVQTAENILAENEFTIIDGSSGLMVPLAGGLLMADFAAMIKLPLVIVCSPGRGAINHTLMTLYSARQLGIDVAGYFINNMPLLKTLREEDLAHALAYMTTEELFGVLSSVKGSSKEVVEKLSEDILNLKTYFFMAPYLPEA